MLDLVDLYDKEIKRESEEYRTKNPKTDSKYRASSSGMCARKIFFESIEKAEPTEADDPKGMRIMRLGTIVHKDIQDLIARALKQEG